MSSFKELKNFVLILFVVFAAVLSRKQTISFWDIALWVSWFFFFFFRSDVCHEASGFFQGWTDYWCNPLPSFGFFFCVCVGGGARRTPWNLLLGRGALPGNFHLGKVYFLGTSIWARCTLWKLPSWQGVLSENFTLAKVSSLETTIRAKCTLWKLLSMWSVLSWSSLIWYCMPCLMHFFQQWHVVVS